MENIFNWLFIFLIIINFGISVTRTLYGIKNDNNDLEQYDGQPLRNDDRNTYRYNTRLLSKPDSNYIREDWEPQTTTTASSYLSDNDFTDTDVLRKVDSDYDDDYQVKIKNINNEDQIDEDNNDSFKVRERRKLVSSSNNHHGRKYEKNTEFGEKSIKLNDDDYIYNNYSDDEEEESEEKEEEEEETIEPVITTTTTTTTTEIGFFGKLKTKFINLFSGNTNDSSSTESSNDTTTDQNEYNSSEGDDSSEDNDEYSDEENESFDDQDEQKNETNDVEDEDEEQYNNYDYEEKEDYEKDCNSKSNNKSYNKRSNNNVNWSGYEKNNSDDDFLDPSLSTTTTTTTTESLLPSQMNESESVIRKNQTVTRTTIYNMLTNYTKAEIAFLANIIKAFDENKKKFIIEFVKKGKHHNNTSKLRILSKISAKDFPNKPCEHKKINPSSQKRPTTSTTIAPSSSSNSYEQSDEFQNDLDVEVATNNSKLDSNKVKRGLFSLFRSSSITSEPQSSLSTATATPSSSSFIPMKDDDCKCKKFLNSFNLNHKINEDEKIIMKQIIDKISNTLQFLANNCLIESEAAERIRLGNVSNNKFENLLKFLAHLHHPVERVGKYGKKLDDKKPVCTPVRYVEESLNFEDQYKQQPTQLSQIQSQQQQQQLNQEEYINFDWKNFEPSNSLQDNSYAQPSLPNDNNNFPDLYYIDDSDEKMYKNDIEQEEENMNNTKILVKRDLVKTIIGDQIEDNLDVEYVTIGLPPELDYDYSNCYDDTIEDDYYDFFLKNFHLDNSTPALKCGKKNKQNRNKKSGENNNHIHHNHKVNNMDEDFVDYSELFGKLKKKKNKKKQKKNRKHRKNAFSTTLSPSTDYDKYDMLGKFFYMQSLKDKLRQSAVDKLPADNTDVNSGDVVRNNRKNSGEDYSNNKNDNNNNFDNFPELKDIKFRLNSEQEEAVKNFIQDLDSPPKVFTFDVDKYIQKSQNNIYDINIDNNFQEQQELAETSTKQFYEFPEMLLIDQNEKQKNPPHDTFSASIYDDDNTDINIPTKNNYNDENFMFSSENNDVEDNQWYKDEKEIKEFKNIFHGTPAISKYHVKRKRDLSKQFSSNIIVNNHNNNNNNKHHHNRNCNKKSIVHQNRLIRTKNNPFDSRNTFEKYNINNLNNRIPSVPLKNCHHDDYKRDLLRQYIKGRTSYLRNHNSIGDDYNGRVDDDILYSLYNNPFEPIKYDFDNEDNSQTITTTNSNPDDEFVDNYYLLNDGKAEINFPESSKLIKSIQTKYNPVNINYDLELNEKFRELENLQRDLARDNAEQNNNCSINNIYEMTENDENDIKNIKNFDHYDSDADNNNDNNNNNNNEKSELESDENIEKENLDDKKEKYQIGISVERPFMFPFH